jgi:hypothetical protein
VFGQTDELLPLAELGPGEAAGEQSLSEEADVLPEPRRFTHHVVGRPQRVGGALRRVIGRIGGPLTLPLPWVDLHELATPIQANQLLVGTDLQLGPWRTGGRRRRVESVLERDVMVGVDLDLSPDRHIVGYVVVGQ